MKSNRKRNRDHSCAVEQLEKRQLLSVVLASNNVVRVTGTPGADDISAKYNARGTKLVISDNGQVTRFNLSDVKRIAVAGGGGDDRIQVQPTVLLPLRAQGGAGNDTLIGGTGADTLNGNTGSDYISGDRGGDWIDGFDGNDRLLGGNRVDTIFGGSGDDLINSGNCDDVVIDDLGANEVDGGSATLAVSYLRSQFRSSAFISDVTGYDPNQIRRAYNFADWDFSRATEQLWGQGQTIYIVDAFTGRNVTQDLATFSAQFDLPAPTAENFQIVNAGGRAPAVDLGWAMEIALDVQWAHAIAPMAKIVLVQADSALTYDLVNALSIAADMSEANGGGVVSLSLGFKDTVNDVLPPNYQAWNDIFARSTKTTFLAASGDDPGILSFPATSPFATAVGGTMLSINQDGVRTGNEIGWHEILGAGFIGGPGGGGGETANFPRPAYQQDVSYPNGSGGRTLLGGRGVPDVAYNAVDFAVYSSTADFFHNTGWSAASGTSAGAPQWAALVALINQRRQQAGQSPAGNNFNGMMYEKYKNGDFDSPGAAMLDIVEGNIGTNIAGVGYDLVAGIGVPNAQALINDLGSFTSFYFQQDFRYTASMWMPIISGAGTEYTTTPYANRPRSGTGSVTGGDIAVVEFLTTTPDPFTDPFGVSAFDIYSDLPASDGYRPIELYRTADGRIYGDGYAIIQSVDPGIQGSPIQFYLKFDGSWSIGADQKTHFSVKFWSVDPLTGNALPKQPHTDFITLLSVGGGAIDAGAFGAYYEGTIKG